MIAVNFMAMVREEKWGRDEDEEEGKSQEPWGGFCVMKFQI